MLTSEVGKILSKNNTVILRVQCILDVLMRSAFLFLKIYGLKLNLDFYCGYSPERINPGDKNTIDKIIKVTSGSSPNAADFIDRLYKSVIKQELIKPNQ